MLTYKGVVLKDEVITVLNETKLSNADNCVVMIGDVCTGSAFDPAIEWAVQLPDIPKPPVFNHTPRVSVEIF